MHLFTENIYKESKQFQAEKEAERIAKKKAEEVKTKELTEKEKLIQSLI